MVATRHSLPSTTIETETSPPKDKKVSNALKKLQIDGTAALFGEKPAREEEDHETYRYRGAAYAVTDLTKQEWLETQPKRWKKRMGGGETDGDEDQEVQEQQQPLRPRSQTSSSMAGKKRAFSLDGAADEEEEEEQPTKKRSRRSAPEAPSKAAPSKKRARSIDAGNDEEQPSPKRTRRNVPAVDYSRSKRKRTQSSTKNKPRKRKSKPDDDEEELPLSRMYDYAVVGGQEQQSCIEASRAHAAAKGYEVQPIPEGRMPPPDEIQVMRQPTADASVRKLATKMVVQNLIELASVNTKAERLTTEYERSKELLEEHRERMKQREVTENKNEQSISAIEPSVPSSTETTNFQTPRARTDLQTTATKHPDTQEPTPPSNASHLSHQSPSSTRSSSVEIITEERHDSATSITPPTTSASPNPNNKERPSLDLPTTNKAGQRVRWSLSAAQMNDDRAEMGINTARMEGESASARRRRVKREFKAVREWKEVSASEG